jgi:hypothetical protein
MSIIGLTQLPEPKPLLGYQQISEEEISTNSTVSSPLTEIEDQQDSNSNIDVIENRKYPSSLKEYVFKIAWLASAVYINFTTTLSVFPATISSIESVKPLDPNQSKSFQKDLFTGVIFLLFNTSDFIGKVGNLFFFKCGKVKIIKCRHSQDSPSFSQNPISSSASIPSPVSSSSLYSSSATSASTTPSLEYSFLVIGPLCLATRSSCCSRLFVRIPTFYYLSISLSRS